MISKYFLPGIIVVAIFAGTLADMWVDLSGGASWRHLLQEALIVVTILVAIAWLVYQARQQREAMRQLERDLAASKQRQADNEQLQAARQQMGRMIQAQFAEWGLTPSEKEVALLLLKGLSFKEIAGVRDTLEKTVRQQASSIYHKADVSGRASFAAWFIEDIL